MNDQSELRNLCQELATYKSNKSDLLGLIQKLPLSESVPRDVAQDFTVCREKINDLSRLIAHRVCQDYI